MSLMLLRLLLLPLLLLFIINLPSSWSLCDLSAWRRNAQTGDARKLNVAAWLPKMIAKRACKQANVKLRAVEEAYTSVRVYYDFSRYHFAVPSLVFITVRKYNIVRCV